MNYSLPKKIQMNVTLAKWRLESSQSILVLFGLSDLRKQPHFQDSELEQNLLTLSKKAKALDIPILDIHADRMMTAMMDLGEYVSQNKQIIFAGLITPSYKALIQHISSITQTICIINDAIDLENVDKHIQWVNSLVEQGLHHVNTHTIQRLWSLSAPTDFILSEKGILLAVAEQLDLEPLEIDPYLDLSRYGLDSVGIVSLVGLWRANGADIRYEDFEKGCSLSTFFQRLKG